MKKVIDKLKSTLKLNISIFSGDDEQNVSQVANDLEIKNYYASLLPQDKLSLVEKFSQDKGLIMVGDGLNDAPALARASVGISLGDLGSSLAIEASDAVLIRPDFSLIHRLIKRSRKTHRIVKQNICLALTVIFRDLFARSLGYGSPLASCFMPRGRDSLGGSQWSSSFSEIK